MQYRVRIFDNATASLREEAAEGESPAALAAAYERAGLVVLSVDVAVRKAAARARTAGRLDVAWWCRELRTLLVAGMTVVEALETVQAQHLGKAREEVHATLLNYLRQGHALSSAMQATGSFPAMLVASVRASERTSALVEALDEYLSYHQMLDRLKKQVVSAAIYPAVVVTLGGLITLFLLLFVIPRFAGMYGGLRGPVSWTTSVLMSVSGALSAHGVIVSLAVAGLAVAVLMAWRAGLVLRLAVATSEKIGPLQQQIDEFRLAKLYHSLAMMFRGGYALDDALRQVATLGLGDRIREGVLSAQASLSQGRRVSEAFAQARLTDVVSQRLLSVGERTGNFDRVLQTIAERHASNFHTFIERATRIVEPLLLLTVALVVGGIVVMMYMPVFDIAGSVR